MRNSVEACATTQPPTAEAGAKSIEQLRSRTTVDRFFDEHFHGPDGPPVLRGPENADTCVRELARFLGPRYAPQRVTPKIYEVYHDGQRHVLDRLSKLAKDLGNHISRGGGLILYGTVGTGKDHLMAAMLYHAASLGFPCDWRHGLDLYGQIRDSMDSRGHKEGEILAVLAKADVLSISDPCSPTGSLSDWRTELLQRIVDRRYRRLKSTWITVNVENEQDADARLSAPVFDRLRENAVVVRCFWPSYRERSASKDGRMDQPRDAQRAEGNSE